MEEQKLIVISIYGFYLIIDIPLSVLSSLLLVLAPPLFRLLLRGL
jgi:hypothetical protein